MAEVRAHIFVKGRVQGVFFRENTRKKAEELGLRGWARNLQDGRVEAVFEGEKEMVEQILEWARKGPVFAEVKNVEINWEEYRDEFSDFKIEYT